MRKRIINLVLALVFVPAIFLSVAPVALADEISTEGPDSPVNVSSSNNTSVTNNNNVSVNNSSSQTARSGDATVSGNTHGGSATSGDASNSNSTEVAVSISNLSWMPCCDGGGGSISTSGPDSPIRIRHNMDTRITNNNDVNIYNRNHQRAGTGDARVSDNTHGGSARSGDARNHNDTDICVAINNSTHGHGGGMAMCPSARDGGGAGGPGHQAGAGAGGQVLGVTAATMVGGKGGAFSALPSTGVRDGLNLWLVTTILVLLASVLYWQKAIAPKLKTQ